MLREVATRGRKLECGGGVERVKKVGWVASDILENPKLRGRQGWGARCDKRQGHRDE